MTEPSIQELRKEATALGIPGGGSKDDLAARVAAARGSAPNDADERDAPPDDAPPKAKDRRTAWIGGFHVEVDSEVYRLLTRDGAVEHDPPEPS